MAPAAAGLLPRDELKALYTALLRAFCPSDDAMLSMCRRLPRKAAGAARTGEARTGEAKAGAGKMMLADPPHDVAPVGPDIPPAGTVVGPETSAEYAKRMFTGSAIAVGASAALA